MDMDATTLFKLALAALFALEAGINMAGHRSFVIPLKNYTDESVRKFLLPNGIAMLMIAAAFAFSTGMSSLTSTQFIVCAALFVVAIGIVVYGYTKILVKR